MRRYLKYTTILLLFGLGTHHKAEAAPIVRDTVTELVLTYADGTSSYVENQLPYTINSFLYNYTIIINHG